MDDCGLLSRLDTEGTQERTRRSPDDQELIPLTADTIRRLFGGLIATTVRQRLHDDPGLEYQVRFARGVRLRDDQAGTDQPLERSALKHRQRGSELGPTYRTAPQRFPQLLATVTFQTPHLDLRVSGRVDAVAGYGIGQR